MQLTRSCCTVPSETKRILTNLGRVQNFSFDRPAPIPQRINITSYGGAQHVLENQDKYKVTWHEGLSFLMGSGGSRFMLSGDSALHARQRECMRARLYGEDDDGAWRAHIKAFYAETTARLIREKSYRLANASFVDVVRDVGNAAPVHFAARTFNLPLKTARNPGGIYSEQELYAVLAVIFICIFFDFDPAHSFPMRQAARAVAAQLGRLVEANVGVVTGLGFRGLFAQKPARDDPLAAYGVNLIKGLKKAGLSNYDIAWSQLLPTAGASVPNIAEVVSERTYDSLSCINHQPTSPLIP